MTRCGLSTLGRCFLEGSMSVPCSYMGVIPITSRCECYLSAWTFCHLSARLFRERVTEHSALIRDGGQRVQSAPPRMLRSRNDPMLSEGPRELRVEWCGAFGADGTR